MDQAITRAAGATPSTTPPAATAARAVGEFKGYIDGEPAVRWLDRKNMPQVGDKLFAAPARAAGAVPRSWAILLTSANHSVVGPLGSTFPHAGEKHERVLVVEVPAAAGAPSDQVNLKLVPAPSAPVGASVDTQALRDLVNQFLGMAEKHHRDERACLSKWGEIVAHIDQHVASQVHAAFEAAAKVCDEQASLPECPERANYCADAIRALKFTPSISHSGEGAAQAGQVAVPEWISVDERLPDVPKNSERQFIIACRRANGKAYVFAASYLNALELDTNDDGEAVFFGWHTEGEHAEYSSWYEPVCQVGDEVTHWHELPPAPSPASESLRSPQEAVGTEKGVAL